MALTLEDANGILWSVTYLASSGTLETTNIGSGTAPAAYVNDPGASTSWLLGITTAGYLSAPASVTFNSSYPANFALNGNFVLVVTPGGLLQVNSGTIFLGIFRPELLSTSLFNDILYRLALFDETLTQGLPTTPVSSALISNYESILKVIEARISNYEASEHISETRLSDFESLLHVLSGASPVTPTTTNLAAWYEADSGVTGTNPVTAWADKSPNGNNLGLPSGTSILLTNQINGLPAVEFGSAGNSAFGFGTAINLKSAATIFAVIKLSTLSGKSSLVGGTTASFIFWFNNAGSLQGADSASVVQLGQGNAAPDLSWHQLNVNYSAGGSTIAFRIDKASDGSASPSAVLTNLDGTIGVNPTVGSEDFKGYLAALLIYTSSLSPTDIATVESYLQQKYFSGANVLISNYESFLRVIETRLSDYESLEKLAEPRIANYEAREHISETRAANYESLLHLMETRLSDYESLFKAKQSLVSNYEALEKLLATHLSDYEAQQHISQTRVSDYESRLALSKALASNYEALQKLLSVKISGYESLLHLSTAKQFDYEALEHILSGLISNYESVLKSGGGVSSAYVSPYEALEKLASARIANYESRLALDQVHAANYEALQRLTQGKVENYEALEHLLHSLVDNYESLLYASSSKISDYEALLKVLEGRISNYESRTKIASVKNSNYEALAKLIKSSISNYESFVRVTGVRISAYEDLQRLLTPYPSDFEALQKLSSSKTGNYESFVRVSELRAAAMEALQGVRSAKTSNYFTILGPLQAVMMAVVGGVFYNLIAMAGGLMFELQAGDAGVLINEMAQAGIQPELQAAEAGVLLNVDAAYAGTLPPNEQFFDSGE